MASQSVSTQTVPPIAGFEWRVQQRLTELGSWCGTALTFVALWNRLSDEDRQKLGGDFPTASKTYSHAVAAWRFLRSVSPLHAILQISHKIDLITQNEFQSLREAVCKVDPLPVRRAKPQCPQDSDDDFDEVIEKAREQHDLVIVQGAGYRRWHWSPDLYQEQWSGGPQLWNFFWQLASNCRRGAAVGIADLDINVDEDEANPLKDLRFRLVKHLQKHTRLWEYIKPGEERRTYRLDLNRNQVKCIALPDGILLNDLDSL